MVDRIQYYEPFIEQYLSKHTYFQNINTQKELYVELFWRKKYVLRSNAIQTNILIQILIVPFNYKLIKIIQPLKISNYVRISRDSLASLQQSDHFFFANWTNTLILI